MMRRGLLLVALLLALRWVALPVATESFDHSYADYRRCSRVTSRGLALPTRP
jgi:hypothetical protein